MGCSLLFSWEPLGGVFEFSLGHRFQTQESRHSFERLKRQSGWHWVGSGCVRPNIVEYAFFNQALEMLRTILCYQCLREAIS
jgi:hypothetical protein